MGINTSFIRKKDNLNFSERAKGGVRSVNGYFGSWRFRSVVKGLCYGIALSACEWMWQGEINGLTKFEHGEMALGRWVGLQSFFPKVESDLCDAQ